MKKTKLLTMLSLASLFLSVGLVKAYDWYSDPASFFEINAHIKTTSSLQTSPVVTCSGDPNADQWSQEHGVALMPNGDIQIPWSDDGVNSNGNYYSTHWTSMILGTDTAGRVNLTGYDCEFLTIHFSQSYPAGHTPVCVVSESQRLWTSPSSPDTTPLRSRITEDGIIISRYPYGTNKTNVGSNEIINYMCMDLNLPPPPDIQIYNYLQGEPSPSPTPEGSDPTRDNPTGGTTRG